MSARRPCQLPLSPWDEIKRAKILESAYVIEGRALHLSKNPMKKVLEIGEFLRANSTYVDGERGAVKAILPYKIHRKLQKNVINDFPVYGNDRRQMLWKLTRRRNVFKNRCLEEVHQLKTAEMLGASHEMTDAEVSGLTFQDLDAFMMKAANKKMNYTLGLGQPSDRIAKRLQQYHPDSFKDYLRCHHQYVCRDKGPDLDRKCRAITTMPGLATSIGIVSPPGTMTAMHPEDSYLCSINVHVLGGIKLWVVIDSDAVNYKKYRDLLARELNGCANLTREKQFILRLPLLVNNDIRFGIIFQALSELIVTQPYGEHQILNPQSSITMARNLALKQNIDAFTTDEELFSCECANAHFPEETEHLRAIMAQLYLSNWLMDLRNACDVPRCNEGLNTESTVDQQTHETYSQNDVPSSGKISKKFACNECPKQFTRKTTLTEHLRIIHLQEYDMLSCQTCGKVFGRKRNLIQHERGHKEKPLAPFYECPELFKNFHNVKANMSKVCNNTRFRTQLVGATQIKISVA